MDRPASLRPLVPAACLIALLLASPLAAAAELTVSVVESPDVVVTTTYEGETYTSPRYLFTSQATITNGEADRSVSVQAVVYLDGEVTGCPEQQQGVRPVHKFAKNLQLEAGETVTVGGASQTGQGSQQAYWPMEVFQEYPRPGGGSAQLDEGRHTMCVLVLVSGNDPACDKPETQACTLASAPFRPYVRHTNQAPHLTELQISPEDPRPGQGMLFQAQAEDNDTEPHPDELTYTWDFGTDQVRGSTVRHTFTTPGTYEVSLTLDDGFETVTVNRSVTVAGTPGGGGGSGNGTPGPGMGLALAAVTLAAIGGARRRRG